MLLTLENLALDAPLNGSGECLVFTELVLPRNAIRTRSALTPVRIKQGRRSFARAPFYEKALLKERVVGRFGLKVSVTRPMKHQELQKFLRQLMANGFEFSSDLLAPLLVRHSLIGDVLDEVSDRLLDSITDSSPNFVATGGLDLDSATLTSGKITVPLKLAASIRQSNLPPGPISREKRRTKAQFYKKGSTTGQVSLDLELD